MQSQFIGDFPVSNLYRDTKRNNFLILASPGHYRESLVGLLQNLPDSEISLFDPQQKKVLSSFDTNQSIVLVDLPSLSEIQSNGISSVEVINSIRDKLPGARIVLLVDNYQQSREAQCLYADCILPRSVSAGQFLNAVRNLGDMAFDIRESA